VTAARQLAEAGGYEAVQMRDVVQRTGMSSATIYRHFSSKDHLLAEVRLEWLGELRARKSGRLRGATAGDRVADVLRGTVRAFQRSPLLGKAVILASQADDPGGKATLTESYEVTNDVLREAVEGEPIDVDEYLMLLGLAWNGALVSWAQGRLELDDVDRLLQRAARVLLEGARRRPG
jgi:TetR/AcrR family transcriptional regulator, cholesterol catabolism regulator